ncbi:hypothetical protein JCM10212_003291 [Sporobolomyces blumeae]
MATMLPPPPDAPRIGTAGSPLDPPPSFKDRLVVPRDGLGLGGIDMPDEMKGSATIPRTASDHPHHDPRYAALRPHPRPSRHAPSTSSPPSLVPFSRSLVASMSTSPAPPVATALPRKYSLQQPQPSAPSSNNLSWQAKHARGPTTTSGSGHARKYSGPPTMSSATGGATGGVISYPFVSRVDSDLSTFTPSDVPPRPAPGVPGSIDASTPKSGARTRLCDETLMTMRRRVASDGDDDRAGDLDEERTPTPRQKRPATAPKPRIPLPPPPSQPRFDLDLGSTNGNAASAAASTRRRSSARGIAAALDSSMAGRRVSESTYASSHFDSSDAEDSPLIDDQSTFPTTIPTRLVACHRRAVSEESPRILQATTFNRSRSAEEVPVSEIATGLGFSTTGPPTPSARLGGLDKPAKPAGLGLGLGSSVGGPSNAGWTTASPALVPISEVKAMARAKAQAQAQAQAQASSTLVSPVKAKPTGSIPRSISEHQDLASPAAGSSTANSIHVSVRPMSTPNGAPTEMGQAKLGRDGVTVCLRSYASPKDLEVAWTCVPGVDDHGRSYTQWEMQFRPRSNGSSSTSAIGPVATAAAGVAGGHPVPIAHSVFENYRMDAPVSQSAVQYRSSVQTPNGSTTSPFSEPLDPLASSARRKSSSTSTSTTGRSDSFSRGTSISSESSVGPPSSTVTTTSSHRRRKSSYDFGRQGVSKLPPPPPLPSSNPVSYFDIPVLPTNPSHPNVAPVSAPAAAQAAHSSLDSRGPSPGRTARSSSYNVGPAGRSRQFSIDPNVHVPRSASVPENGIAMHAYHLEQQHHSLSMSASSSSSSSSVKSPRDHRFARCIASSTSEGHEPLSDSPVSSEHGSSRDRSNSIQQRLGSGSSSSSTSSFLASRLGRKNSMMAPPAALSIPTTTIEDHLSSTSHRAPPVQSSAPPPPPLSLNLNTLSSGIPPPPPSSSGFTPSPLGRTTVVRPSSSSGASATGDYSANKTPTRTTHRAVNESTTPTPSPPIATDDSVQPTVYHLDFGVDHHVGKDDDEDEDVDDDGEEDQVGFRGSSGATSTSERKMRLARHGRRMMSRWSDTETEEDDDSAASRHGPGSAGLTSWGRLPDAASTDEDDDSYHQRD